MEKQRHYVSVVICRSPRTEVLLDKRLSDTEKKKRISRYFDKKGNLKIDTVKEHTIFGTK